jgi:hypothetical protein
MRRTFTGSVVLALLVLFLVSTAMVSGAYAWQAASTPAQVAPNGASQQQGVFTVALANDIDSKKLKPGDQVEALLSGSITLPSGATAARNAKIVGHVTQATSRGKGEADSTLGIVFDKIVRAPGEETPIKGVIKAVAPNPTSEISSGGNAVDYGNTMRNVMTSPPDMTKPNTPLLTNESSGVLGLKNLKLGPDGVLTSSAKEVKLERGTRLLLNVTMQ